VIEAFAAWPVRHPNAALLLLLAFATAGLVAAPHVAVDRFTPVSDSEFSALVRADVPGIDLFHVQSNVVRPLDEALSSMLLARERVARSVNGGAEIELRFSSASQRDAALEPLRRQVEDTMPFLPQGMQTPVVEANRASLRPAAVYAITSSALSAAAKEKWAEQTLQRALQELPEVGAAELEGIPEREIVVEPDMRRVAALGLSFDDLIDALKTTDVAPPRDDARRRGSRISPASTQAVAARAVRHGDGEPVALSEVAQVSLVTHPAATQSWHKGMPAIHLKIYPPTNDAAAATARRADAYLGWLRANGMVPAEVKVEPVLDEAKNIRSWLRRVWLVTGICLVAMLAMVYAFFGFRRSLLALAAFCIWLPFTVSLLWPIDLALNPRSVSALLLAYVPLALAIVRAVPIVSVMATALIVGSLAWAAQDIWRAAFVYGAPFALGTALAALTAWLMTAWLSVPETDAVLWTRMTARKPRPAWAGAATAVVLLAVALSAMRVLPEKEGDAEKNAALILHGEDSSTLIALGTELLPQLRNVRGVTHVEHSWAQTEDWVLHLDPERIDAAGLTLAQIGRAFAVARAGVLVGDVVDADARLPVRLRLPSDAAGETFSRLVLQGETGEHKAIYLRDVGEARRMVLPRQALLVQGIPAVEVRMRVRADTPVKLQRLLDSSAMPDGYRFALDVSDHHDTISH
jgi:multidrug efflux pump subunit AcrB